MKVIVVVAHDHHTDDCVHVYPYTGKESINSVHKYIEEYVGKEQDWHWGCGYSNIAYGGDNGDCYGLDEDHFVSYTVVDMEQLGEILCMIK